MKRGKFFSILSFVLVASLIIISVLYLFNVVKQGRISIDHPLGPLLLIALLIFQGIVSVFPVAIIILLAGSVFGGINGAVYCIVGIALGFTVSYFIGKDFGRKIEGLFLSKKKIKYLDNLGKKDTLFYVFLFRLSGIFPSDAVSFSAGINGMKFIRFLVASLLGCLPLVLLLSFLGETAAGIIFNSKFAIFIGIIAFTMLVFHGYFRHEVKKCKKHYKGYRHI